MCVSEEKGVDATKLEMREPLDSRGLESLAAVDKDISAKNAQNDSAYMKLWI